MTVGQSIFVESMSRFWTRTIDNWKTVAKVSNPIIIISFPTAIIRRLISIVETVVGEKKKNQMVKKWKPKFLFDGREFFGNILIWLRVSWMENESAARARSSHNKAGTGDTACCVSRENHALTAGNERLFTFFFFTEGGGCFVSRRGDT